MSMLLRAVSRLVFGGLVAALFVVTASGQAGPPSVREVSVVDKSETRVLEADSAQLTLITCFPFNAIRPSTSLRYVVIADLVT